MFRRLSGILIFFIFVSCRAGKETVSSSVHLDIASWQHRMERTLDSVMQSWEWSFDSLVFVSSPMPSVPEEPKADSSGVVLPLRRVLTISARRATLTQRSESVRTHELAEERIDTVVAMADSEQMSEPAPARPWKSKLFITLLIVVFICLLLRRLFLF